MFHNSVTGIQMYFCSSYKSVSTHVAEQLILPENNESFGQKSALQAN